MLTFYSHKGFKLGKASLRCTVGYDLNSQVWRKKVARSQHLNAHKNPQMQRKDEVVRVNGIRLLSESSVIYLCQKEN